MSSCGRGLGFRSGCEVGRYGRAQQDGGYRILGRSLGAGMAAGADALLASAQPEPAGLGLHRLSGAIEQFDLDWLFAGNAQIERAVVLDLRRSLHLSCPLRITRI